MCTVLDVCGGEFEEVGAGSIPISGIFVTILSVIGIIIVTAAIIVIAFTCDWACGAHAPQASCHL
jgi:hypothetical protein